MTFALLQKAEEKGKLAFINRLRLHLKHSASKGLSCSNPGERKVRPTGSRKVCQRRPKKNDKEARVTEGWEGRERG